MKQVAIFVLLVWGSIILWTFVRPAKAQNSGVDAFFATAPHTACPTPAAATGLLCFASDGLYISENGGALTKISTGAVAGVTSWNGLTGAVTYVPPVSSVNGKTGVVVLSASTSLN